MHRAWIMVSALLAVGCETGAQQSAGAATPNAAPAHPPPTAMTAPSASRRDPKECVDRSREEGSDEAEQNARTNREVTTQFAKLRACGATLKQKAFFDVLIDVNATGSVDRARVTGTTTDDCMAVECVRRALVNFRVSAREHGDSVRTFVELSREGPTEVSGDFIPDESANKSQCLTSDETENGRLAPEEIQAIIRSHYAAIRRCYEAGLGRDPSLTGRVEVRFVIGRDGRASHAQVWTNTLPDCEVTACMRDVIGACVFPEPKGGIVTVIYPLRFEPAG